MGRVLYKPAKEESGCSLSVSAFNHERVPVHSYSNSLHAHEIRSEVLDKQ